MAKKSPRKKSEHVARAKNIIRQKTSMPTDQEVLDLTRQLKQEKAFGYARKLLGLARKSLVLWPSTKWQASRSRTKTGCRL